VDKYSILKLTMEPFAKLTVEGVYVCDEDVASTARAEIFAGLGGIEGDRHFGTSKKANVREQKFHERGTEIWNSRQWSAVSVEEMQAAAYEMGVPDLRADWIGANFLVSGIPEFSKLPSMTRLVFSSGATLLVYDENHPCSLSARSVQKSCPDMSDAQIASFVKSAMGRRGVVGWVERAGIIRPGDSVLVHLP
jgi:hypothetical protein